jgi:Putative adhesin
MRLSPWGRVVAVSAILVIGAAAVLAAGALASRHERLVSYPVTGALDGASFDLGEAAIAIVGGGPHARMTVQRTERYAFGHDARTVRTVSGGVLRVTSSCPTVVPDACSVRYRVVVPDNVPVDVHTRTGAVSFRGYRGSARVTTGSGNIEIGGFCGFSLQARTDSGRIDVGAACPPQDLSLRASTGSLHAVVPAGRSQVDATSASGRHVVRGVESRSDAPFSIQALSSSGDVLVEGRR